MAKNGKIGLTYSRRSVVYGREHMASIERQEDSLREAVARDGLKEEAYSDAQGHRSGHSAKHRPEYRKLEARLSANDVRAVYFDLLDRAWRNVEEWNRLLRLCRQNEVTIKLVSQGVTIDSDIDPFLKIHLDHMAVAAEFESLAASDRQKRALRDKRKKLIYWGSTPFGSRRVGRGLDAKMLRNVAAYKAGEAGALELIPGAEVVNGAAYLHGTKIEARIIDHGATVAELMELYASGYSFAATASELNSRGFLHIDRRGRLVPFASEAVRSIAWNVLFYSGFVITSATKWSSKHSRVILSGEGSLLDQYAAALGAVRSPNVEPIVSEELACRVISARLKRRRTGRSLSTPRALLTPLLYHVDGRLMRATMNYGVFSYRTRLPPYSYFPVAAVDEELLSRLRAITLPDEIREEIKRAYAGQGRDEEKARIRGEISRIAGRSRRVLDNFEEGHISKEERDTKLARLRADSMKLQAQLDAPDEVESMIDTLTTLGAALDLIPMTRKKRVIAALFDRVEIDEEGHIAAYDAPPAVLEAFSALCQLRPRQDSNPNKAGDKLAEAFQWFMEHAKSPRPVTGAQYTK